MRAFGHCRFSWFGISDTGREIKDADDARARLWHPHRMAIRFHLFETVMLPSLACQTDPDFTLLLTVSEDMPQVYQERLEATIEGHPFVRLNRTLSRDYFNMISPFMLETTAGGTECAVHFRIDDDDALPASYIARLRRDAQRLEPGGLICYSRGIVGFLHGNRAYHGFRHMEFHAQGLAMVAGPGVLRSPLQLQHRRAGGLIPSYVDPSFVGFHFTQHGVNNTKGYGAVVHEGGVDARFMYLMSRSNPELAAGAEASADCDASLAESFPFTTGPMIRARLRETTDPQWLCETFGFAQE